MLKNFLTTVSRQLWRNRLFTFLNIIGLSVSICVAWIVFRMVSFEYSFDKQVPGIENIYQVISKSKVGNDNEESGFAGVSKPVFNALKNDVSGADLVIPMFYKYQHRAAVNETDGTPARRFENGDDIQLMGTTADYFRLLPYRWLAGNAVSALDAPDKVVLTDTRARVYFPNASPQDLIGKTIVYDDTVQRRISGIVAQLDFPNSFSANNNEFIALDKEEDLADNNWGSKNSNDLVFIKTASSANTQKTIDHLNALENKFNSENFEKYNYRSRYEVIPLSRKHFEEQFSSQTRTASKKVLKGLMTVGAFLLLLACINYINLTTAQLPQRAREIGIRKTLGSSSRELTFRFIGETAVVTSLAALLSFVLAAFAVRLFSGFLPEGLLAYMNFPAMAAFLLSLIILVAIISGLYPAWLAGRVNTVNVLKGNTDNVTGRSRLPVRKGLIVFQFLVAQVFIIGSIIIHQQIKYALNKNLGFDKNGIITLTVPYHIINDPRYKDKQFILKEELLKNPALQAVSLGTRPM
ncbi:MAG: ABC transporter permease, partial [Flavihumibacter sp.]